MIKSNSKTCTGRLIISAILPKAITANILPKFNEMGFSINELLMKRGLLTLTSKELTIEGMLNTRMVSISCNGSMPEAECKNKADELLRQIEKSFK